MDATANFSLRFARPSESKVETLDWLLSRQTLQRISTGISLISLALGFWVFAMLIIINRHQADLNDLAGGSTVAMIGGSGAQHQPTLRRCRIDCCFSETSESSFCFSNFFEDMQQIL